MQYRVFTLYDIAIILLYALVVCLKKSSYCHIEYNHKHQSATYDCKQTL